MRRRFGLLILIALLSACAAPVPKAPTVVQVPITRYVAVPDALTAPCPVAMPKANTVAEAIRVARERRAALERCNARMDEIRNLVK